MKFKQQLSEAVWIEEQSKWNLEVSAVQFKGMNDSLTKSIDPRH
jgi:hypothetical protein